MKGQMFLLASVIIATIILVSSTTFRPVDISVRRKAIEVRMEEKIFQNVFSELEKTVDFSYDDVEDMFSNVVGFSKFLRKKMYEHSIELKIFHLSVFSNTSNGMNITCFNLLGETTEVNLTLNSTPPQNESFSLTDGDAHSVIFTFTPGVNYVLSVSYLEREENITVNTSSSNNKYLSFFDARIVAEEDVHRKVSTKDYKV